MKPKIKLIILSLFVLGFTKAKATHLDSYGGHLSWSQLNDTTLLVELYMLHGKCGQPSTQFMQGVIPNFYNLYVTNDCGVKDTLTLHYTSHENVLCQGIYSFATGRSYVIYHAFVPISMVDSCSNLHFEHYYYHRKSTLNVPYYPEPISIEAEFYREVDSTNSSPYFDYDQPNVLTVNDTVDFYIGAIDVENDSLVFFCDTPKTTDLNTNLIYPSPYTIENPYNHFSIDSLTGMVHVETNEVGFFWIKVRIEEYDRNTGTLLSITYREMVYKVFNFGQSIELDLENTTSETGSAYWQGVNLFMCAQDSVTLEYTIKMDSIPNMLDINFDFGILDSANFNVDTLMYPDSIVLFLSLFDLQLPGQTSNPISMEVGYLDSSNTYFSTQQLIYLRVLPGLFLPLDFVHCFEDTIQINSYADTTVQWMIKPPGATNFSPVTFGVELNVVSSQHNSIVEFPGDQLGNLIYGDYEIVAYTSFSSQGCPNSDTLILTVDSVYDASMNLVDEVCSHFSQIDLVATNPGGQWMRFSNNIPPNTTELMYNSYHSLDSILIQYVLASPQGNCVSKDSTWVEILSPPAISFVQPLTCENNPIVQLIPSVSGGVFSGPGLIDSTLGIFNLSPYNTNPYAYYHFTDTNGCSKSYYDDLVVYPNPDAYFPAPFLCDNDSTVQLVPNSPGGVFSGGSIIDSIAGYLSVQQVASWDTVSYFIIDSNGCTDYHTTLLNINNSPSVSFIHDSIYCNDGSYLLTTNVANGVWSGIPVIDTISGEINGAGLTGGYLVSLTKVGANGCDATYSDSVFFYGPNPVQIQSNIDSVCLGDTFNLSLSLSSVNSIPFVYGFSDTTIASDFAPIDTGTHVVYGYSSDSLGACLSTDSIVLFVQDVPQFGQTVSGAFCIEDSSIDFLLDPLTTVDTYEFVVLNSVGDSIPFLLNGENLSLFPEAQHAGFWVTYLQATNNFGCVSEMIDSIVLYDVVDTNVIVSNDTLSVNLGYTYQWLNCDSNTMVAGAIYPNFSPSSTGNYACVITNGSCADTTRCVYIDVISGLGSATKGYDIHLFPNPVMNQLNIQGLEPKNGLVLSVYNSIGELVYSVDDVENEHSLSTDNWSKGVYHVVMIDGDKNPIYSTMVIKQ